MMTCAPLKKSPNYPTQRQTTQPADEAINPPAPPKLAKDSAVPSSLHTQTKGSNSQTPQSATPQQQKRKNEETHPKNSHLTQRTIRQLQPPLRTKHLVIIQGNNHPLRLLVHQHGVSMAERSPADILSRYTDVVAFEHEGAKCHCLQRTKPFSNQGEEEEQKKKKKTYLSSSPINPFTHLNTLQPILNMPLQLRMDLLYISPHQSAPFLLPPIEKDSQTHPE